MKSCFHAVQHFLRSHDLEEVAKALGYHSLRKGESALEAILQAPSLKAYVGEGHYDLKYDTRSLLLAVVKLAGLDEQACASAFDQAKAELDRERGASQPYIEAIPEKKNLVFGHGFSAVVAYSKLRRRLDKDLVLHAKDGQWQTIVQQVVRDFMAETQGTLPQWGKIEGFVYHHTNGEEYLMDTEGNIREEAGAASLEEKFRDIPVDEDTRIISREFVKVGDLDAVREKWSWEGILGETLIFATGDVKDMDDVALEQLLREQEKLEDNLKVIIKRGERFVFVNFRFEAQS